VIVYRGENFLKDTPERSSYLATGKGARRVLLILGTQEVITTSKLERF
jgi:hypothetical protein